MQLLAQVGAHTRTRVDLVAMFDLSVLTLNTIVSKQSEIEKRYLHCGPSFFKEHKCMKTLPLEELETILLAWFMQACTTSASIDGSHLKEKALHIATRLDINGFRASNSWINFSRKDITWYTSLCQEKVLV
jgi:hypothetical protein